MNGNHFILDFETLGVDTTNCVGVNCAYMTFNADRFLTEPYTFEELVEAMCFCKLDVKSQVTEHGYKVERSVVEWWSSLPANVKKQAEPSENDDKIENFLDNMLDYLDQTKPRFWWSRSNTFDPIILVRMARDTDRKVLLETRLKYWAVRDIRTFLDTSFNFQGDNRFVLKDWESKFEKHNSIHDVAADVLRMQEVVRLSEE